MSRLTEMFDAARRPRYIPQHLRPKDTVLVSGDYRNSRTGKVVSRRRGENLPTATRGSYFDLIDPTLDI